MRPLLLLSVLLSLSLPALADPKPLPKTLVVHEWGTFTSLQDESGRAIGYLNSSAEPLPPFVHRLRRSLLVNDIDEAKPENLFLKGEMAAAHPDVTMRLETPVIYFHPADKNAPPFNINITTTFNGGVLSEFYPAAKFHIEGGTPAPAGLDRISDQTEGSLTWQSLTVGGSPTFPKTDEHVWLAPRKVAAAPVSAGKESEQYVFYRGVGHVESPLIVTQHDGKIDLIPRRDYLTESGYVAIEPAWIARFDGKGGCVAQRLPKMESEGKPISIPASLADAKLDLAHLRAEMKTALIAEGLFEDEAEAMLGTWEQSYFHGVGERVFFVVPPRWTEMTLPLSFSMPAEVTRVMIGRVELVTPQQREALTKLPDAKAYESLGRFGYALVLDELRQHSTPKLAAFAKSQGLRTITPTTRPAPIPAVSRR